MSADLIRRLEGEVYFVPGKGKGRFPCCHGFLFKGSEIVLMDAGIGENRLRELDRKHRIDVLIITHSHPDHIRNASLLHDRHLFLPRETPDCVMDLLSLGERFMGNREDGAVWARFVHDTFGVRALRNADERYWEGQILSLGGAQLEPIHAPGHLIDHYCFLERNTGTLISTDIDLTFFGPWYGNPESNIETFRADVERLMNLPYRRVCSSHKEPVEGDASDLFENYLAAFERQRKTILSLCDPPRSLDDIAKTSPFYHNALSNKTIQFLFERRMTEKNLELLVRDGLAIESEGVYSLPAERPA